MGLASVRHSDAR